ncbi:hypothetical protein ACLB2K_058114 [Fragaria x ananassa]
MTIYNHSTSMKRDGHNNASARLHSTNTTGQGASQTHYIVASHTFILALITNLGFCIPLKFPNGSPYATVHGSRLMNIFIIEMCAYLVSLIVMGILARRDNAELEDLMNKICLFFGTLPVILELLVLIEPFGWFISFIWSIFLLCFMCKYHQSVLTLWNNAVERLVQAFREFRQTLIDWRSRMRTKHDEVEKKSISNLKRKRAIELQPQNRNMSIKRRATEHQSQNQNHSTVTEHAIAIPDNS